MSAGLGWILIAYMVLGGLHDAARNLERGFTLPHVGMAVAHLFVAAMVIGCIYRDAIR